ncbi:MAG TPA: hypothetical protein PL048_15940 [Leptospiraceae bacterium]|nr:hypothetical protein [Leptospiraceae bacterium]HMY66984.1 hypothetical protein [Leptospiraceae bacterium]HMZ60268.1 hypothetical protein [Leptospiraceae bacterium]HNF15292.1 hypothetical protein [Leptospiraceae bacterium]HNF26052.1 hypothetical protein [Leptospiraceae bacterium]
MEFLLFLFFYLLSLAVLPLCAYYYLLFSDSERESFSRSELIDMKKIIPRELIGVIESNGSLQMGLISFFSVSAVSYLWSIIGGIFSESHYSHEAANYIFHSFLLPGVLFFSMKPLANLLKSGFGREHFLTRFAKQEIPILAGVSITLIAACLSVYGAYHEMKFPLLFLNILIIAGLFAYKLHLHQIAGLHNSEEDFEEDLHYSLDEEESY